MRNPVAGPRVGGTGEKKGGFEMKQVRLGEDGDLRR